MKRHTVQKYAKALVLAGAGLPENAVPKMIDAFFSILKRNRMMSKAPEVLKAYLVQAERSLGAMPMEIVTKQKLDSKTKKIIHEKFGKERELVETIDHTLSGGFLLKDGDTVYHATVDSQLKKFANHLIA